MDILASTPDVKQFGRFWQQTNRQNARAGLPVEVRIKTESQNIANMFKIHFRVETLNIVDQTQDDAQDTVDRRIDPLSFSVCEVNDVIRSMKRGRSPGCDGLSVEHLQYTIVRLSSVLSMLYNLCVSHGYLPDAMMMTVVVPIVKNRTGDVADRFNYRPISIATIIAKVLDSQLDTHLNKVTKIHDAQFGFEPELSTESAII
ncbi:unnamed protein product [Euphydryas editha]|nr:unnamed protein product [Euphydryas editha]